MLLCVGLFLAAAVTASPSLPAHLEWRKIGAMEIKAELTPLLRSSYVATPDDALLMDYGARDLAWMLGAPGASEALRVGLGEVGAGLVAFVCAVPSELLLRGEQRDAVEVSLLCVRRDWRGRGLTKLLLQEVSIFTL